MKSTVLIVVFLVAFAGFAEKQPISRYQSIIDRQMFGPLPPGFDPTKSPNEVQKSSGKDEKQLTQEQAKLQSSIHFSVINVASDGQPEVGFTDNSDPKAPKHYFLKVGESRDGWTVKDASAEDATMTIAKGDIEVSLSLGGNSAKDGGTSRAGGAAQTTSAANATARRPGLLGGGLGTLRARRLQRQQDAQAAAAKQQAESAAKEAERQAQAEAEKQQREAERAEQRQQLLAIQEELKRVREAKAAAEASKSESGDGDNGGANDEAE